MAVKLRKKALANGKMSLYLDLYNGEQRKYEFLKLHLYKRPKDELEKQHNKAVTQTAENIRAKRELPVNDVLRNTQGVGNVGRCLSIGEHFQHLGL